MISRFPTKRRLNFRVQRDCKYTNRRRRCGSRINTRDGSPGTEKAKSAKWKATEKLLGTVSEKPAGIEAVSQVRITRADHFGLWLLNERMPDVLSWTPIKCSAHFRNWKRRFII